MTISPTSADLVHAMSSEPVEILHPDGELAPPEEWFPDTEADTLPEDPFLVVAITGPQASGKSTLVNAVFKTSFPVSDRSSVGMATTAGILAQRVPDVSRPTLVFDVEGADARARGRDAKLFAAQCASFVSALADVVIVNLWYHDACRLDSSAYSLLRSVLNASAQALVDGASVRTALVVAVRDVDDGSDEAVNSLHDLITNDVSYSAFAVLFSSSFVSCMLSLIVVISDLFICLFVHVSFLLQMHFIFADVG